MQVQSIVFKFIKQEPLFDREHSFFVQNTDCFWCTISVAFMFDLKFLALNIYGIKG